MVGNCPYLDGSLNMKAKAHPICFLLIFWGIVFIDHASAQVLDPLVDYRYTGVVLRDADGKTLRSTKVIRAFRKLYACPSTNAHIGACPGWSIDHVGPIDCGFADAVYNMQWLPDEIKSAAGPFSKDHFERRIYGGNGLSAGCP